MTERGRCSVAASVPVCLEACFRFERQRLLAVARRYLRNEEDARDAVQDAFLSAHRGRHGFRGESSCSTWLYRIVANCCLMKLRARRRRREISVEDLPPWRRGRAASAEHEAESIQAALERKEIWQAVCESIDRLPERYRTVVLLRDLEGCGTEQTARRLGVTPSAVKVRLHRARKALRLIVGARLGPPPAVRRGPRSVTGFERPVRL